VSDRERSGDGGAQPPSRSARKRAAHAAQALGESLLLLPDAELDSLGLPPELLEALRAARRIRSRAAGARQRQYIGRLMRALDPAPIRAALAARSEQAARERERSRRIESWRERLIVEGEAALDELARWYPDIDRAEWAARVGIARRERAHGVTGGAAARQLFRALRTLFATMPQ
jgi:ribosome-associated protein